MNDEPGPLRALFLRYLTAIAPLLATTKPIRRVPGWWSGHAFASPPDPQRLLRERVLDALSGRTVRLRWYGDLRLELRMGTDISRLLFIGGEIDPNEFAFLADVLKPGMHVIDAGANEGLYTLFFRGRVGAEGRVIAIEPSARESTHLQRNLALNGFRDVDVHALALGDARGQAVLNVAENRHAGHNALGLPAAPWVSVQSFEDVRMETLDALATSEAWPKIDLIKLDIEGMEFAALRGAETLLMRDRPVLLLEAEPESLALRGDTMPSLLAWLRARDYVVNDFSADGAPAALGQRDPVTVNLVAISR